jgi:hypothetical protein
MGMAAVISGNFVGDTYFSWLNLGGVSGLAPGARGPAGVGHFSCFLEVARRTAGIVRLRFTRPEVRSLSYAWSLGTRGVKGKAHCAISVVPTLAQRTRKDGAPPALVVQAGKA